MEKARRTILLVDDTPEDRELYRLYLTGDPAAEYHFAEATLGQEALSLCQTLHPDCLLLDQRLPDLDGVECLARLQAQYGAQMPPVVLLTGIGNEALAVEAMRHGAQDYLVKGQLTADALRRAVQHAIERADLRRALEAQRQQAEEDLRRLNATLEQRVHERTMLLEVIQDVTRAANEATSSTEALQYAVDRLCAYVGWPVGHAYLAVAPGENRWVPTDLWYLHAPQRLAAFREATLAAGFAASEGMVGQVGALGKPVWSVDVTADPAFQRRQAAVAAGLKAGFALPVLVGPEVAAVLEFYAYEPMAPNLDVLDTLLQLGTQLGRAIERERAAEQGRRQQEALFQREKLAAMGALLASVAHELNNPLATIMMHADLLRTDTSDGPLAEYAEDIHQAAVRCERLVRQFLTLARQHVPERVAVDLNALVTDTLALLAHPLRVDNITVDIRLEAALPRLWADPHQLQQVLVNLVTNAQQALREVAVPRRLTLTTRADAAASRVILEVSDTGPGIPLAVQARIFEPFFTTKPSGVGTGLGLPLCQGIIESHDGTIRCTSQPGRGTTFRIELPAGSVPEQPTQAAPETEESRPTVSGLTILVVDDEPSIARGLIRLLARDGHTVDTAANGRVALDKLRERSYDLILSDLRMPELDGPGLYKAVAQQYPPLRRRFIFLTGDTLSPEGLTALTQSEVPRLTKPFRVTAIRRVIQQVLQGG